MNDQEKLFEAIENNKYDRVKKILTANPELVNAINKDGKTPLQLAVYNGYLDVVKFLIERGADINTKDKDGETPLQLAIEENDLNVVKLLVENGADVNTKDEDGETPLHNAAEEGDLDVVKFLIKKGADVNAKNKDGETPLHNAAEEGDLDVVKLLIERGADVNAKDLLDFTPLYAAVGYNNLDIVRFLIENGADINTQNILGKTPLHVAANLDGVKFLIENGADVNAKDKYGNTPLYYAVEGNKISIIELIVNHIAQLEAAGLRVDEQNLQLSNQSINYPQNLQECKEEIEKITKENKSLIDFLKAENSEESRKIWVEDEDVRNAFDDQERLKKQYPKYADMLIHKANEVKKEIFLHNHEPLIDALSKLCKRNFNSMTFNDIEAFCNDKYFVIDNLKLPLTNFIDFGDVKAKHSASPKVQTFAKTVEVSKIRIEENKNVSTPFTDLNTENVEKKKKGEVSRCNIL